MKIRPSIRTWVTPIQTYKHLKEIQMIFEDRMRDPNSDDIVVPTPDWADIDCVAGAYEQWLRERGYKIVKDDKWIPQLKLPR